jgi:hypothetical protein
LAYHELWGELKKRMWKYANVQMRKCANEGKLIKLVKYCRTSH